MEFNHPGLPRGTVCVRVPEIDRQQNHISLAPQDHPLLSVALHCLEDKDHKRPSAHQLCERVAPLKGIPKYRDSARSVQDKDDSEVVRSLALRIEEKDHTISSKEEEIQQLKQERDRANNQLEEKETELGQLNQQFRQLQIKDGQYIRQIEEKERQLRRINQQLEASEQVVAQFERRIAELEQQLGQREQQKMQASSREKEQQTSFKLRWREGKKVPRKMYRDCDAVVSGNTVYVMDGTQGSGKIYSYDVAIDMWSKLPDCIYRNSSITVISCWLTTIGGTSYPIYSNELFSLTGEGSDRKWTKNFLHANQETVDNCSTYWNYTYCS